MFAQEKNYDDVYQVHKSHIEKKKYLDQQIILETNILDI